LDRFKVGSEGRHRNVETVFLYSGSLIWRKGVDVLARSFVRLRKEGHNARLKVLGTGPLLGMLRHSLSSVSESVEFIGFSDWSELPQHYASSNVLCVPSRYDGWGLVVPEGLASGLPVIATTRTGAALEFLETGKNGWLIESDNDEALLNAMREAASVSHATLGILSKGASASVENHSLDQGAARFKSYVRDGIQQWNS